MAITAAARQMAMDWIMLGMFTARKRLVRFIGSSRPSMQKPKAVAKATCGVPNRGCTRLRMAGRAPARPMANR
ncbi:hypothetical protein D3C80_1959200 [compost metagenome]